MGSKVAGMRAAAATTLRNLCIEDKKYRKEFVEMGGLKGFVAQLSADADPALNHTDVQLEAVLNLQDLIEEEDGSLIEEYAKVAIQAGAVEQLKKLTQAEDEEVRGSAEEMLTILVSVLDGGSHSNALAEKVFEN